ncbi:MAG: GNAT family N-acetyltransferase [Myxococcales bacterium]|nr:MAG: GNAT family N-acetyltransferase [Myxococcales bacterium]
MIKGIGLIDSLACTLFCCFLILTGLIAMSILVRSFLPDDYEAFRELRLHALRHQSGAFASSLKEEEILSRKQWIEKLSGAEATSFLAWDESVLVGMCGVYSLARMRIRHKAYVWGMYIDPKQRGKGVGEKLLEQCKQWAIENNKRTLLLAVMQNNTSAIRLYERFGFVRYGLEPASIAIDGVYYDDILFALSLESKE